MTSSHVFALAATAPGMPAAALSGARPEYRGQRILAVAAMLVAVAIGLPCFLTHSPYSRFGVQLVWPHETGPPVVDKVVGPPSEGLLLHGDALVAVNGEVLTRQGMREHFRNGWPRGPLELVIERGGRGNQTVLPPGRLRGRARVRNLTLPPAAGVSGGVLGVPLGVGRPPPRAAL